ncbi:dockerin type I domain-containing protein [Rubripirellula amarantea]|nr:dockerin type I domain-containing protein [Rubripirellula amarantea]
MFPSRHAKLRRRLKIQGLEDRRLLAVLPGLESIDFDGHDITVGIISDSFNTHGGIRSAVMAGELPGRDNPNGFDTPVEVLSEATYSRQDRGRGIAELIHDVAPAASLIFHAAPSTYYGIASTMSALVHAGADVIVTDMQYPAGDAFLESYIDERIREIVSSGVTVIAAAGNAGDTGYLAPFESVELSSRPGDVPASIGDIPLHDFDSGPNVDVTQSFTLPAGQSIAITLSWNGSPYYLPTGSPSDEYLDTSYQLFLTDEAGQNVLDESFPFWYGNGYFVGQVSYHNETQSTQTLNLIVGEAQNVFLANPVISIIANESLALDSFEYKTHSSPQLGVSTMESVITVGASRGSAQARSYSSIGGREIEWLYDPTHADHGDYGTIDYIGATYAKPNILAPDGDELFTLRPEWNVTSAPDSKQFYSTSASAAKTAGLVALMLEASEGGMSPEQVRQVLEETAKDIGPTGFDFVNGHGVINADVAVQAAEKYRVPPPFEFAFTAELPDGQRELFVSDGTDAGTRLLRDLSGKHSSDPRDLTSIGGRLFFTAVLPSGERELFRSDGTADTTALVSNLAGTSSSNPRELTVVGNTLFFVMTQRNGEDRVYKTTGSRSSTVPVSATSIGQPQDLFAVEDQLCFLGRERDTSQQRVYAFFENGVRSGSWKINPPVEELIPFGSSVAAVVRTSAGRRIHALVNEGSGRRFARESRDVFAVVGPVVRSDDSLFFTAADEQGKLTIRRAVLSNDGRTVSTNVVAQGPELRGNPESLTVIDDQLFFTANIPPANRELMVSDVEGGSTRVVRDLFGTVSSDPQQLTAAGDRLFFTVVFPSGEVELLASDPTLSQTYRVKDLSGNVSSDPKGLTEVSERLVFSAVQGNGQRELYTSDGTSRGTRRIANLSGSHSSDPKYFAATTFQVEPQNFVDESGESEAVVWAADASFESTDVNRDGKTSAVDALMIINAMHTDPAGFSPMDVNGDRAVTALDALVVINRFSRERGVADIDGNSVGENGTETDDDLLTLLSHDSRLF